MEKALKNLIKKSKKYYMVVVSHPELGQKTGKVNIFFHGKKDIVFDWDKSELSYFVIKENLDHPPMSFDENTQCIEVNKDVYNVENETDWVILLHPDM